MVTALLDGRAHPQQAFRSCLGILRLADRYSPERLEAACRHALAIGAIRYKSIKNILDAGLDQPTPEAIPTDPLPAHANVRGADYYR